jgi:hypothetical protein
MKTVIVNLTFVIDEETFNMSKVVKTNLTQSDLQAKAEEVAKKFEKDYDCGWSFDDVFNLLEKQGVIEIVPTYDTYEIEL